MDVNQAAIKYIEISSDNYYGNRYMYAHVVQFYSYHNCEVILYLHPTDQIMKL